MDKESQKGSDEQGDVASKPRRVRDLGVDDFLDDVGDVA